MPDVPIGSIILWPQRYDATAFAELAGDVLAADTEITVTDQVGFPDDQGFVIRVGNSSSTYEWMLVTAGWGTDTWTVTRGYYNTTPRDHSAGRIVLWDRTIMDIPAGWALCDGGGGTRDLRDRTVLGAGDLYLVGATGGQSTLSLPHTHEPGTILFAESLDSFAQHSHDFTLDFGATSPATENVLVDPAGSPVHGGESHSHSATYTVSGSLNVHSHPPEGEWAEPVITTLYAPGVRTIHHIQRLS